MYLQIKRKALYEVIFGLGIEAESPQRGMSEDLQRKARHQTKLQRSLGQAPNNLKLLEKGIIEINKKSPSGFIPKRGFLFYTF